MKNLRQLKQTLAIVIIAVSLIACGGGKNEYSIKSSSPSIKGDVSECFEVVDGTYKLEKMIGADGSDNFKLNVQLKRTEKSFDFTIEDHTNVILYCDLLEDNGTPFINGSMDYLQGGGYAQTQQDLLKLKSGETSWVYFIYSINKNITNSDYEKAKTFSIRSVVDKPVESTSDNSPSSTETTASSDTNSTASNASIDDMIKSYGDFIDQYVILMKKAKAGDASAMSDYAEMLQKAQDLQQKLTDVQGNMTPAQVGKLLKLEAKLTKAAVEISK